MPRATVDVNETTRHDLKSCPGGYVVLRRLSYGEYLQRREMVGRMRFTGKKLDEAEMVAANKIVTAFEFKNCIVEHNLEDDNGQLLDFRSDISLRRLDPRIGEEIGNLIDAMHAPPDDEESLGNSGNGSEPASS